MPLPLSLILQHPLTVAQDVQLSISVVTFQVTPSLKEEWAEGRGGEVGVCIHPK